MDFFSLQAVVDSRSPGCPVFPSLRFRQFGNIDIVPAIASQPGTCKIEFLTVWLKKSM
jgi:hypothetical protein